jgi:hypothetical protein
LGEIRPALFMQNLILNANNKSPNVIFDQERGYLEISGKSIPENSYDLYKPLLDWVDDYTNNPADKTTFVFRLTYFNSSSAEYILDIMKKLELLYLKGANVEIKWYYDAEDEDMEQIGEDFKAILKIPIEMLETEEEDSE